MSAKTKGSASVPSKKALLKSARVPEKVKEYCSTTIIEKELLTTECRDNYRIVEGDLISKPRLIMETIEKKIINMKH